MLQEIQSEVRDCRKWQRVRETLVLPELATSIPKETRTVRHVGWDDLKRGTGQRGIGTGSANDAEIRDGPDQGLLVIQYQAALFRNGEAERAATAEFALHPDFSAMKLNQRFADGQS